jgi:hypothetical protein
MKDTRSSFLRTLLTETRAQLEAAGFTYRGRSWYERPLGSETTAIVTLASNTYRGDPAVYINPSLGIRHERLEQLLAELSGHQLGKFPPATISTSLGYVTPAGKHIMYSFTAGDELSAKVKGLVQTISKDGLPWMQKNQSVDAIYDGLAGFKFAARDGARFRVPLVHYLKGDYESACVAARRGLEEIGTNQDLYSQRYRHFANGLLDLAGARQLS